MRILIIILLLVGACGTKDIGKQEMLDHYAMVKNCMGLEDPVPAPNVVIVPDTEKVMCNGFERRGCYTRENMTITLPQKSDETTIRHEMVHHLMYATVEDVDPQHKSEYFLRCSGVILESDTE